MQDAAMRLDSWDDQLRRMTSQSIPLYRDNRVAPIGRLVRWIEFYRREEGTGDLVRIAESPNAERLRGITIHRCDIGSQGITALASSPYLNDLTHLRFTDTYLPRGSARELLSPSGLPRLCSLELIECGVKSDDLAVLPQSSLPARLVHLNLSDNLLDDGAAVILAQLTTLRQLQTLDLSKNGLSSAAHKMLAQAPHLARTRLAL
ncbi:MAG: hypothetical protein E6J90_41635 [Deltaproteobacteria bacterium]|nr:MAG: hypothetical protein E6J91_40225 [Deltaproteobacteria bacterium]TMQ08009.1 MAG: hypothetical protein E6J90_41635 [Deltaproteobacteria bacterium]